MNTRIFLAAVVAASALAGCADGAVQTEARAAAPVRVATVEKAPAAESLRAVGVLAPADEVRLSFKTGGVIQSITVEQGTPVTKGQVLATLAQDEVAAAVTQARAVAEQAARDLERGKALLADEVATREQVEALETAHAVVEAMRIASKRLKDDVVVVCFSGRGDKDCAEVARLTAR